MRTAVWLVIIFTLALTSAQAQISGYDPRFIDIDGNVTADDGSCNPAGPPGSQCIDWITKQSDGTLGGLTDGIGNNDGDILSPGSTLGPGSTLPKEDVTRVWLSNNTLFLYVAEERRANNGNSAYHLFMTQLAPTAVEGQDVVYHLQNGDLEIQICFPKGSDPAGKSIVVRQVTGVIGTLDVEAANIWTTGAFQPVQSAATAFEINTSSATALTGALDSKGNPAGNYDTACFAEAAISLAALNLDPCGSRAFASVITRSSCSLTSDVKDFCGPFLYSFGGPVVSGITEAVDCDGDGTFSASASAGTPPYRFQWYDNGTLVRDYTAVGTGTVEDTCECNLTPGSHQISVTVTDSALCPDSANTDPFLVADPLSVSLSGPSISCTNTGCVTATVSGGVAPYTYAWSDNGTALATPNPPTAYCPTWTPGSHNVGLTVTDSRGCTASAGTGPFTAYGILGVSISGTANCRGVISFTATPSGGNGPFTYAWTVDGAAAGTGATFQYGPAADCANHQVCVTVTDSRSCTSNACKTVSQTVTTTGL